MPEFISDEAKAELDAWPFRDSKGRPMPDPAELAHFVYSPDTDMALEDDDEE